MSRLTSFFLISLFLNLRAGDELLQAGGLRPRRTPLTHSLVGAPTPHAARAHSLAPLARDLAGGLRPRLQAPSLQGATPEARGASLARLVEDRDTGRDARIAMRMRLFDRQGRVRERALTVTSMRGGPGRPVPADRSLVRFTFPADIRGTGFLVWEQADADDERFLYLPSLGRVRRIAASESQESFVGSDFTYEDIGGREFENYTYRLIETPSITTAWKAPDGSTQQVYRLESTAKDPNARFPRVTSWIRQDNLVVVRAEIRNRRDEIQKTYEALRVERVSGYWTVMDMRMTDALQRTRTDLTLEKVEYNVGLSADDFSRRELERGGSGIR